MLGRVWVLLWVVGLCACRHNTTDVEVQCGDGTFCAVGKTCLLGECVDEDIASACVGIEDGNDCNVEGVIETGVCKDKRCIPQSCGNGVKDPTEECDCGSSTNPALDLDNNCEGSINSEVGDAYCRPNCQIHRCGDGITDALAGEECDDGDVLPGGNCSSECKFEVCGNGVVDFEQVGNGFQPTEECDDANFLSMDGCLSTPTAIGDCASPSGIWETQSSPTARRAHQIVYDAGRDRVVLFGGKDASDQILADTWEWDGLVWRDVTPGSPLESPLGRTGHAMAYDAGRRVVVMQGGISEFDGGATAKFGDTWEWDGRIWQQVDASSLDSTLRRTLHSIVYDAKMKQLVMFGGFSDQGELLDDTQIWNETTLEWEEAVLPAPEVRPPALREHRMAFDAKNGNVVLFGGEDASNVAQDKTWLWDGQRWSDATPVNVAERSTARTIHSMAYDAASETVVVFGGNPQGASANTWEWNGSAWSQASIVSPSQRQLHAMAYDTKRQQMVLFGGLEQGSLSLSDTQLWQGGTSDWVDATPPPNPGAVLPPRKSTSTAYDSLRGKIVLFGGLATEDGGVNVRLGDTWEWNGSEWTEVIPTESPSPRREHSMTYDSARQELLLFGGFNGTKVNELWSYNGTTWTQKTFDSESGPIARTGAGFTFDAETGEAVLFGGVDANAKQLNDTWTWNGTAWTQRTQDTEDHETAGVPQQRAGAMLAYVAYDATKYECGIPTEPNNESEPCLAQPAHVLLFGGNAGPAGVNKLGDTWVWKDHQWTEVEQLELSPTGRQEYAMEYDASLRKIVLFGGFDENTSIRQDTWEWDGKQWQEIFPGPLATLPDRRSQHNMSYDAARGRMVMAGGQRNETFFEETWQFSHRATGPEACLQSMDADGDGLVGCADPDCWGRCTPLCPPFSTDAWPSDCDSTQPYCGDGVCNENLESARLCPQDNCPATPVLCGDFHCDSGEDAASCPGDCP